MMSSSFLRRELAPIGPEAWNEIEVEARRVLSQELVGRKTVDFHGPVGWDVSSLNLGTLKVLRAHEGHVGLREIQPFAEFRVPFTLDIMALDSLSRGNAHPDLSAVAKAAIEAARIENEAVFHGLGGTEWQGMKSSSTHEPIALASDVREFPRDLMRGLRRLRDRGVGGPFALVLGASLYDDLIAATDDGYPVAKHIEKELIGGELLRLRDFSGAIVVSKRGGDYELTVGQDLAIGFADRNKHSVELYLAESFVFRVLEPQAAIYLAAHPG